VITVHACAVNAPTPRTLTNCQKIPRRAWSACIIDAALHAAPQHFKVFTLLQGGYTLQTLVLQDSSTVATGRHLRLSLVRARDPVSSRINLAGTR